MITIKTALGSVFDQDAKCRILFLPEETGANTQLKEFENAFDGLSHIIKDREFTGKLMSHIAVPVSDEDHLYYMVLVGLGAYKNNQPIPIEHYRRAVGKALRIAEDLNVDSIACALPDPAFFGVTHEALAEQTASMLEIAYYKFDTYFTASDRKTRDIKVALALEGQPKGKIDVGVERGLLVGKAVNQARHWIDLPPSFLTPTELADKALEISQKSKLKYTVFNEQEVNQMGMGGLAGVSRGSENDCKLVIMEYKSSVKNAPTLAFVGKGITFDSGGLSLKPAVHMETMKEDMSGAAAVIAAMGVIGQIKPDVNVIGLAPLSENLPSGKATKPGDIVTFYNGKTAEIKNTDAEGRLVLADALAYATKHYKPNVIIDIATLTGSCAYALGPFFTGLMSQDESLVTALQEAALRSGDRLWPLPLDDDYKIAVKSAVADLCNIGSNKYRAGAITAGHFLGNFVGDIPWAHLDIAGTAYDVPDLPYYRPSSATGVGVRLFVDLALNWPVDTDK